MLRRVALLFLGSVHRILHTANGVLSSPSLAALIIEALRSSETSVLTRATRRNFPDDSTLRSTLTFEVGFCNFRVSRGFLSPPSGAIDISLHCSRPTCRLRLVSYGCRDRYILQIPSDCSEESILHFRVKSKINGDDQP
jgi:hypothetical protein